MASGISEKPAKFKFPPAHVAVLEKAFDDGLTSTNSNNAQWFLNLAEQLGTTIERVQKKILNIKARREGKKNKKVSERRPVRWNGYTLYANEFVTPPGMSGPDLRKLVGQEWRKLTPELKKPYEVRAAAKNDRPPEELSASELAADQKACFKVIQQKTMRLNAVHNCEAAVVFRTADGKTVDISTEAYAEFAERNPEIVSALSLGTKKKTLGKPSDTEQQKKVRKLLNRKMSDFLGKKVRFSYKQLKTGEITVVGLPSGMTTSLLTRSGNLAGVGPSDLQKILDAEDLISVQAGASHQPTPPVMPAAYQGLQQQSLVTLPHIPPGEIANITINHANPHVSVMDSMGQGAASPGDTSAENSPALSDPHVSVMDIMGQGAAGDTSAVNSSASSDVSDEESDGKLMRMMDVEFVMQDNEKETQDDSVEQDSEQATEYFPKRIVNHRYNGAKRQYRIQWRGYPLSQATWEPVASFALTNRQMILDYHSSLPNPLSDKFVLSLQIPE